MCDETPEGEPIRAAPAPRRHVLAFGRTSLGDPHGAPADSPSAFTHPSHPKQPAMPPSYLARTSLQRNHSPMSTYTPLHIQAGRHLARFVRYRRTMILSAVNDGGTLLELTGFEPGQTDRPVAVFERGEQGALVDEWSLAAYILGLTEGTPMRSGLIEAVKAALAAIFDGADLDPELEIEILIGQDEPASEAA